MEDLRSRAWLAVGMKWIVRNPKYSIPIGAALAAGLAWLAFGFFGVHLLFIDNEVAEAPPVFAATESQAATTVSQAMTPITTAPAEAAVTEPAGTAPIATAPPTTPQPTTPPVVPTTTQPQIVTEYSGSFVGRDHPTSGNAIVLGDGSGQRFLRFEAFETDNGPDLNVYLVNSSAGGVNDFIDLGNLKGNIGDQNYEIPTDADLDVHDTVLIWCVRFSSPFGEATLTAT
jgi:hypothetical protein